MMTRHSTFFTLISLLAFSAPAQPADYASARAKSREANPKSTPQKVVVITGARFSYNLIEKWIDDYNKINPNVQIIVESRGSSDPQKYDILAEVYEHPAELKAKREYIYIARYAVLPVATSQSSFAKIYKNEGLTKQHIVQIYFHDLFADKEKEKKIKAPYTVYTRLQKAGVPMIFSQYFGYEQKDIKGNGIAGADTHLVKALLKDSTGVSYLPTAIIYGRGSVPIDGLSVIPVDINGNNKVSEDEKFVDRFESVVAKIENADLKEIKNIPVGYLHLSVDRESASAEAIEFIMWVNENGGKDLHQFGFLAADAKKNENDKFNEFASRKGR